MNHASLLGSARHRGSPLGSAPRHYAPPRHAARRNASFTELHPGNASRHSAPRHGASQGSARRRYAPLRIAPQRTSAHRSASSTTIFVAPLCVAWLRRASQRIASLLGVSRRPALLRASSLGFSRRYSSLHRTSLPRPASQRIVMGFPRFILTLIVAMQVMPADARIVRSAAAKAAFAKLHPCPATHKPIPHCPGYVIDHVKPLCAGGADKPSNMQWQTIAVGTKKDAIERRTCAALRRG